MVSTVSTTTLTTLVAAFLIFLPNPVKPRSRLDLFSGFRVPTSSLDLFRRRPSPALNISRIPSAQMDKVMLPFTVTFGQQRFLASASASGELKPLAHDTNVSPTRSERQYPGIAVTSARLMPSLALQSAPSGQGMHVFV
jgi:hypothetical protein